VTWHRIYFLWYVIAFLVAMWTVPAPEPSWGFVMNFRPVQSDCIVAHLAMREHPGDFREPVAVTASKENLQIVRCIHSKALESAF
jgi:hypothetical protein